MKRLTCLLAGALLSYTSLTQAGFTIMGTRVIYHEAENEATVQLQRTPGTEPVLLQVWLDNGNPGAQPGAQDLPFLLNPAVSRVDPDRAQVIRIWRVHDNLPTDRESLLFFNALEIPATQASDQQTNRNALRLAMQARMKFFYRPKGLQPEVDQAADLLRFTLEAAASGVPHLRLHNPTPYHITIPELTLHATSDASVLAQLDEQTVAPMVAPFGELVVPLRRAQAKRHSTAQRAQAISAATQVRYSVINDMGGRSAKVGALNNAS